jgi:hypothetical protein
MLVLALTPLSDVQMDFRASSENVFGSRGRFAHCRRPRQLVPKDKCTLSQEHWTEFETRESQVDLISWLKRTYETVQETLEEWTVSDLAITYEHAYHGKRYALCRRLPIWRIMEHDIDHGRQISELLAMKGIYRLELTLLGGHLTEPPIIADDES